MKKPVFRKALACHLRADTRMLKEPRQDCVEAKIRAAIHVLHSSWNRPTGHTEQSGEKGFVKKGGSSQGAPEVPLFLEIEETSR